jgi:hypothetical protein
MFSPAVRSENSVFWRVKETVRRWFKRCRKGRRFRERFGRKRVVVKAVPFFCITITLSVSDPFILEPVDTYLEASLALMNSSSARRRRAIVRECDNRYKAYEV